MYYLIKKSLFYSLFLVPSSLLFSQNNSENLDFQTSLSMEETWNKAVEYSKEINLQKIETNVSKEEIVDSKYERWFPEVNLRGSYDYATNMLIYKNGLSKAPAKHEIIHYLYKISTDFYYSVYDPKLSLNIDKKKVLADIAEIQKELTISEIKLQAAAYYLNLQRNLTFKDLIIKDIANQEKQLEEIKSLYKQGVILKSDVLGVTLKLSNQKMLLVKIENDIAIANQRLNILIGLPDHEIVFPFEKTDPKEIVLKPYEEYLEIAKNNSYDYHISEKNVALKKIELKDVKANIKPKVGFSGEFYLANPQIFLYPYSPSNYLLGIFGVKASIPISELFANKPKTKIAKMNYDKEELEHHHVDDKIRQNIFEKYLHFQEALIQIDVAQDDINQSVENTRIIHKNYFNSTALITDLLDADIQLLQSRFNLVSAKVLAQIQYYQLKNVLGTL